MIEIAAAVPLAHHTFGHWFTAVIVYVVPVLLLAAWLLVVARRSRRGDEDSEQKSTRLNSSGPSADD